MHPGYGRLGDTDTESQERLVASEESVVAKCIDEARRLKQRVHHTSRWAVVRYKECGEREGALLKTSLETKIRIAEAF